ncbi:hypothetical protein E3N88_19473 [Mikania micrantha]|uniref:Uncharacterized protein n=1 Tax=Mikania micrantha TaxID=192012 RepID=A0A5N6NRC8_9ASTR|nr:hypothetical protein E3N88_19473 [Mikania micrantha]
MRTNSDDDEEEPSLRHYARRNDSPKINEDIDGGGAEASEEIDGNEEASEIRDCHWCSTSDDVNNGVQLQQISDDLSVAGVRLLNSYDTCIQIIRNSLKLNTVVHIIRSREKLNTFGV